MADGKEEEVHEESLEVDLPFGMLGIGDEEDEEGSDTGDVIEDEALNEKRGFTTAELHTCERVIGALASDVEHYRTPLYRELRTRLKPLLETERKRYFKGMDRASFDREYDKRKTRNARRMKKAALDRKVINSKQLRNHRLQALKQLQERAESLGYGSAVAVPDGAASHDPLAIEAAPSTSTDGAMPRQDAGTAAGSGSNDDNDADDGELTTLILSCYTCKMRFTRLHHFYAYLCPTCAALNFEKRTYLVSLENRIAIITGGRVKIGFQIGLKLLRAGARVIVTSRFPRDAIRRYKQERDYGTWGDRLQVYGLDLRVLQHVERFCDWCIDNLPCVDIIINNACQTIRRPPMYYRKLVTQELTAPAPAGHQVILPASTVSHHERAAGNSSETGSDDTNSSLHRPKVPDYIAPLASQLASSESEEAGSGGSSCGGDADKAAKSTETASNGRSDGRGGHGESGERGVLAEVGGAGQHLFPQGLEDVNEQQIDLRDTNSWLLKLGQVTTPEVIEVMSVNAVSPFIINGRLQDHLLRSKFTDRYIVNVSAMEGKFYRFKTPNHPHTNMAKAALNMMTRTAALELASKGIFMTAVDTGWINDENPVSRAAKIAQTHDFQTPIDEVDAASRVVDPVFVGVEGRQKDPAFTPLHGVFLKDYQETEW